MGKRSFDRCLRYGALVTASALSLFGPSFGFAQSLGTNDNNTATPIKHVIIVIGENRTFDHVFATYKPVNVGGTVFNLLSEGIIKPDGTPGTNYNKARQYSGWLGVYEPVHPHILGRRF